jgi:hypothetical protein
MTASSALIDQIAAIATGQPATDVYARDVAVELRRRAEALADQRDTNLIAYDALHNAAALLDDADQMTDFAEGDAAEGLRLALATDAMELVNAARAELPA